MVLPEQPDRPIMAVAAAGHLKRGEPTEQAKVVMAPHLLFLDHL